MDLTWCHNPPFRFPNTTLTSLYRLSPQHLQRWKAHNQLPFFDPRHLFSLLLCVSSCSSLYWALLVPGDYLSRVLKAALHLYVSFWDHLVCMWIFCILVWIRHHISKSCSQFEINRIIFWSSANFDITLLHNRCVFYNSLLGLTLVIQ